MKSFVGSGVGHLFLHFFSCTDVSSGSLFGAAFCPVMVMESM